MMLLVKWFNFKYSLEYQEVELNGLYGSFPT